MRRLCSSSVRFGGASHTHCVTAAPASYTFRAAAVVAAHTRAPPAKSRGGAKPRGKKQPKPQPVQAAPPQAVTGAPTGAEDEAVFDDAASAPLQLDDAQHIAVDEGVFGTRNMFVTGSAGTGKSVVLREIIENLERPRTMVVAPTGLAALNIGGTTIHYAFGVPPGLEEHPDKWEDFQLKNHALFTLRRCRTMIIDEVSMVAPNMLRLMDHFARKARPYSADRPFGGIKVVMCGDFLQLPPINTSDVRYCFQTAEWATMDPQVHCLRTMHRAQDPRLAEFLARVRQGEYDAEGFKHLLSAAPRDSAVKIRCTNREVDAINSTHFDALAAPIVTYNRVVDGDGSAIPRNTIPEVLQLREGMRVSLTRNLGVNFGLVNGSTGTVVGFRKAMTADGEPLPVMKVDGGDRCIIVPRAEWKSTFSDKVRFAARQIPLRPSWALTVHRAQGSSLYAVDIDLSRSFERGQAYVALSRATSWERIAVRGVRADALPPCQIAAAFHNTEHPVVRTAPPI